MARTAAILVARLIFAGAFAIAVSFKFAGMADTANHIASVGLPFPLLLAWLAAIFEVALVLAFLTGAFFSEAAFLAGAYVVLLAFLFYGPGSWGANPMQFGLFVNHFTFLAGLLFAAVHGPGERLALRYGVLGKREPLAPTA
jgi:putative oxidoreductase